MTKNESYQPSEGEIKKTQEMADAVQNEKAEEMMTEKQKENNEINTYENSKFYSTAHKSEVSGEYTISFYNKDGENVFDIITGYKRIDDRMRLFGELHVFKSSISIEEIEEIQRCLDSHGNYAVAIPNEYDPHVPKGETYKIILENKK